MDRLITDISNASRLDAELARETREVVDMEKLLCDIAELYATTRKEGQAGVVLERPHLDLVPYVLGSPTALGQIFRNLVDNAISFSPADSQVVVRFWLEGSEKDRQRSMHITVSDDGPGIPPDNLESIFKRFYTERPAGTAFGNNSGLGLAISRQIVESHGGEVWAENAADTMSAQNGAVFHVLIPLRIGEGGHS